MFLIVLECVKLYKAKELGPNLRPCSYIVRQLIGVLCFYTVHERLLSRGYILPIDIHLFWWYKRLETSTSSTIEVQTRPIVLNPAVVCRKGRPRGSKNKENGHGVTATRRDPLQFEYAVQSLSAPAVGHEPSESTAVQGLLAHNEQEEQEEREDNRFIDIEAFDDKALIDPQLWSTTQIGIAGIEGSSNTYCPRTLPPRLYQTNPFSRGIEDQEASVITHELTSCEVAPTAEELQAMADEEDDEQALSQAMETFIKTTRIGRTVKASLEVAENREAAKEVSKRGGHRGRGRGRGGSRSSSRGG